MLQAVVLRNVRNFKSAIHAEISANALTSLRIPIKVILTTSQEIWREVFLYLDFVSAIAAKAKRHGTRTSPFPLDVKLNEGTGERKMLPEYKTKTNVFISLGLIAEIAGVFIEGKMAIPVSIIARVLIITGCCFYAKGKGYSGGWGLLGLLSILGLIVLICMKDRRKEIVRCTPSRIVFKCPNCSGGMEYNGVLRIGQKVQCPHCQQHFSINSLN